MAAYVKVANADDLQPGQAKLVEAGDERGALFNVDGTCYAISTPAPIAPDLSRKAPSKTMS